MYGGIVSFKMVCCFIQKQSIVERNHFVLQFKIRDAVRRTHQNAALIWKRAELDESDSACWILNCSSRMYLVENKYVHHFLGQIDWYKRWVCVGTKCSCFFSSVTALLTFCFVFLPSVLTLTCKYENTHCKTNFVFRFYFTINYFLRRVKFACLWRI